MLVVNYASHKASVAANGKNSAYSEVRCASDKVTVNKLTHDMSIMLVYTRKTTVNSSAVLQHGHP
eukprot:21231-Heterococcus_DN1.PRE.15